MSASSLNNNVIVVAGAGTGKTFTLVQECLGRLLAGDSIDEMLVVTFTKAAAAELRERIAEKLQEEFGKNPDSAHLARQIALLDRAQISTLHSFCLELVSRHFSELGLSPRLVTLEAEQAAALRSEALDELFESYYEPKSDRAKAARKMLLGWFRGDDRAAREIVSRLHDFTQTRPNPKRWFAEQKAIFSSDEPATWRQAYMQAIGDWVKRWRPIVESQTADGNPARAKLLALMDKLGLAEISALYSSMEKEVWPRGSKGKFRDPVKKMYDEAESLASWTATAESDPLAEDWSFIRETTLTLLEVAEAFEQRFSDLKRERGFIDFHDLEQFSLQLLWNENHTEAGPAAVHWRKRLKWIFVDEYQDINQAQDRIITALGRADAQGNRFLVGDVKQSIYGFRQADPSIFLKYQNAWSKGRGGACKPLVKNWRSHERILDFVNALFTGVMSEQVGEVRYDDTARLVFAEHPDRKNLSAMVDSAPKVEVHMIAVEAEDSESPEESSVDGNSFAEMAASERQAEIVAQLCLEMVVQTPLTLPTGKAAEYGDIVILLRSAAGEAEAFAKVFSKRGIPFDAKRAGFFESIEVLDLTNLLTILDNPLQDIQLLGVLRSPIGCFSIEELAEIRADREGLFWEALQRFVDAGQGAAMGKARDFLERFQRWRNLARRTALAERLEIILEETGYEDWTAAQTRGLQRRANIRRLIELARQFDQSQGEGLYPFLRYVEEQTDAAGDFAAASVESRGAVRLMTVHQSKGLQFPIVIMAGLHKKFNKTDFNGLSLLDEEHGLCLKARPPGKRRQYETLGFWMAHRRQERKLLHEEMRILYVALTRAEHRLLLVGAPSKKAREAWATGRAAPETAGSISDWVGPWLTANCPQWLESERGQANDWLWRWHGSIAQTETKNAASSAEDWSAATLAQLKKRIEWEYPFKMSTQQEAKSSATALRRALPDEPELARPIERRPRARKNSLAANEAGQVTHRFLQLARLESFEDADLLNAELERLHREGLFTDEEKTAIDPKKLLNFWRSGFGRELLKQREQLQRELTFTARFSRADLRAVGAPLQAEFANDEFIVVQGAADLVAILPSEIWLVDFKTDRIPEQLLNVRVGEYSLQLRIYALALSRIYKRPVTRLCLHFIELGQTEWIDL
jgi:ATP-dependent helicase/nuclease subunit A